MLVLCVAARRRATPRAVRIGSDPSASEPLASSPSQRLSGGGGSADRSEEAGLTIDGVGYSVCGLGLSIVDLYN
jgi:hypothetical protein